MTQCSHIATKAQDLAKRLDALALEEGFNMRQYVNDFERLRDEDNQARSIGTPTALSAESRGHLDAAIWYAKGDSDKAITWLFQVR